jgi:predicted Zn finger-like uncharacterized protein
MEITCPSCQKKYNLNPARLPSGIQTARCKACGQAISLQKVFSRIPAKPTGIIALACPYCGQSYSLKQDQVPGRAETIKCKSCGHSVPLKREDDAAPVHSLKKESTSHAATKPPAAPSPRDELVRLTCPHCYKKYKTHRSKIPAGAAAFNCKACGHPVRLPQPPAVKALSEQSRPEQPRPEPPLPTREHQPAQPLPVEPLPVYRSRKKKWLYPAAGAVLLTVILATAANLNIIKLDRLNELLFGPAAKNPTTTEVLNKKPFLAANMELAPSPGTVETRYVTEHHNTAAVDVDQLKAKIPGIVLDSLFPGHYWELGDTPQMTLDLDTLDIPNADLAELTYEVISIQSSDGINVLRVETGKLKPKLQPGSLFPGNIVLPIKKGTPSEALAKAWINFNLTVPVSLDIFYYALEDPIGSVKTAGGIRITLDGLERDVARISADGAKSLQIIAYDQSGKALATRESMSVSNAFSTRFYGIISALKVVVARNILEFPFEVEVDLNAGKALVLSREPEIPSRMRFNPHPIINYLDFAVEDLDNLNVTWNEGQADAWNDNLSIALPRGPFSGHAGWEVHFFDTNQPLMLAGNAVQGLKDVSFTLEKGKLKQANAAFGCVELNLKTEISRLVFVKKDTNEIDEQRLPSGEKVSVSFNKNEIAYSVDKGDVIQTVAYDGRGRRLKQDQYTRRKDGLRMIYFWGVPVKFELDVAAQTISKLISFDIKKRPVDAAVFQAYQQTIENQREVVNILKSIDRARRGDRSYYGDDLAGLYYLYDPKKNAPLMLVSQAIAHSDPAGQERFGYQAAPYKGYYFTVLSGVESNGVNKDYNRRSKKSSFTWQKGTIATRSLIRHPDLAAIPADQSKPTFFLQWGQVFMKTLNDETLTYLPDGYYNKGWVEAPFIARLEVESGLD